MSEIIVDNTHTYPDTSTIENEGNQIVQRARIFLVEDEDSYKAAGQMMLAFKDIQARIKETLDPAVTAAHKTHRTLTKLRADKLAPYQKAEGELKGKMLTWKKAEDDRVRREQEAAERKRREEEAKRAEQAAELREAGMEDAADKFEAEVQPAPAAIVPTTVPKVAGVSTRKTWSFKVVNALEIKREYLLVNAPAIRAVVKSAGKNAETIVGGIEVFQEETISGRV